MLTATAQSSVTSTKPGTRLVITPMIILSLTILGSTCERNWKGVSAQSRMRSACQPNSLGHLMDGSMIGYEESHPRCFSPWLAGLPMEVIGTDHQRRLRLWLPG